MNMTLRGIALAAATLALAACSQGASDAPSGPASSGSYVDAPAVTEPAAGVEPTTDAEIRVRLAEIQQEQDDIAAELESADVSTSRTKALETRSEALIQEQLDLTMRLAE